MLFISLLFFLLFIFLLYFSSFFFIFYHPFLFLLYFQVSLSTFLFFFSYFWIPLVSFNFFFPYIFPFILLLFLSYCPPFLPKPPPQFLFLYHILFSHSFFLFSVVLFLIPSYSSFPFPLPSCSFRLCPDQQNYSPRMREG